MPRPRLGSLRLPVFRVAEGSALREMCFVSRKGVDFPLEEEENSRYGRYAPTGSGEPGGNYRGEVSREAVREVRPRDPSRAREREVSRDGAREAVRRRAGAPHARRGE